MELLERDAALATLRDARESSARGQGRVVFVSGEPGIGKTSLVAHFLAELEADARVLLGTCDDLSTPRPLGPLRDLAGRVSAPLGNALSEDAAPHELHALLLAELELEPRPTALVLEDVHWADDATLDAITVVGRRIGSLPALLVLTYRSGEASPGHPLHAVLGGIRAADSVAVELTPLSERAVAALAGDGAHPVFAATGGNPFYVRELLASGSTADPPRSVANAVLGRASRLGDDARRLVELVAVVPGRVRTSVLDALMPGWAAAAEEPERRQLLTVDPAYVRFRHELARNAVHSSLPIAARRRLHADVLQALLSGDADPADIVHHAEAAGAEDVIAEYALVAARRATALESNREAYAHYRRAATFVDRYEPPERASVLRGLAMAAFRVGRVEEAFAEMERAIEGYRRLGDDEAVGRCLRAMSRFHWWAGDGDAARAKAREAIDILEPLGETVELAHAYSGLSQLLMTAEDPEQALVWGERAHALATRLGDERTRAHALVNMGSARLGRDPDATATLLEAHAVADAAGDRYEASRALNNLAYASASWARPDASLEYARQLRAYADAHEVHTLASYAATTTAWMRMRAGAWDEAEQSLRRELGRFDIVQVYPRTVLVELAVRRGDPDAAERLAELVAEADRAGEVQRIVPALELATEWALTTGAPMPSERLEQLAARIRPLGTLAGRYAIRVAAWAAVAGIDVDYDEPKSAPYSAMRRRDWLGAADAFGEVGWVYDRALVLSLLEDEASLVEALETARRLRAEPLTRRVAARMRELRLRVPHGPRQATRANPAGLTARQLEVLALLVEGLTNAEIAERLVVSPKTAEHHVAAVLMKLGAPTRQEAARRASELGLLALTERL